MVFTSASFLFAFLVLTAAIYYLLPHRNEKNALLIAASLLFYACGGVQNLPLLLASALLHYLAGLLLLKITRGRRAVVGICVLIDLGVLVYAKSTSSLPLGISFFTFQAISYLADGCKEPAHLSRNFWQVLQYLSFFPQIVSGPLMKFRDALPMITDRTESAELCAAGLQRFTRGLAKKLLLSAGVGTIANAVYALAPGELDFRTAWLGAVSYALQLYFDFSGYTDMALGLGAVFGYTLPENFRYPYCARSITDFWRRWHISLSLWFRDYLYIPLGGSRRGKVRTLLNKLAVWLATGLWHGFGWTYLLWGLWHGLFSLLETATPLRKLERSRLCHVYTLIVVTLGFVFFRAASIPQAAAMFRAMFTGFSLQAASGRLLRILLQPRAILMLVLAVFFSTPVFSPLRSRLLSTRGGSVLLRIGSLLLLALCILKLAGGGFQPFIYSQF